MEGFLAMLNKPEECVWIPSGTIPISSVPSSLIRHTAVMMHTHAIPPHSYIDHKGQVQNVPPHCSAGAGSAVAQTELNLTGYIMWVLAGQPKE